MSPCLLLLSHIPAVAVRFEKKAITTWMKDKPNQAHTLLYKRVYGSVIRNTKTLMAAVYLK